MKTKHSFFTTILCCLLAAALLGACTGPLAPRTAEVFNGAELAEIVPQRGVPVSSFTPADFTAADGTVRYRGTAYRALQGVDVSFYQGEIDWDAAAASGIEFAMIRAGYRGWGEGEIREDERFLQNVLGAWNAGLQLGLYFFSQAVTPDEAREEAAWLLSAAERAAAQAEGLAFTLPFAFDWEPVPEDGGPVRTAGMTGAAVTDCAEAFCAAVEAGGHTPCVYFFRWQGYYDYDLSRLRRWPFWVSGVGDWADFYYEHLLWQYSFTGTVDGIPAPADRNLLFVPISDPAADTAAEKDRP